MVRPEAIFGERGDDLRSTAAAACAKQEYRTARSLSDAGRQLFAVSRTMKESSNVSDRLSKDMARFELDWKKLRDVAD